MCGIAGIWERSGKPVERSALERMGEILRHRGPDGSGIHVEDGLGLVNRRLAILDPTPSGDQPMGLPERGLWLTYNGEIHNYVELRRELEARGATFSTHTDTEVVLHAYASWGTACFERFNGMWALALWDARERRLTLSRDRFGIKPLCYSVDGGRFCFASEPKAILSAFPAERTPNFMEINGFLNGFTPDSGAPTFFANVKNLAPATFLVVSEHGADASRYWGFEPGDEEPKPGADERFRELLTDSIRLRMRSDVPVGTCLSGGLDSSAIAALVDVSEDQPMHCFSLKYDNFVHDESEYAAAAANARPGRFQMHWVRPEPGDLLETMRRIVWHHDAPMPIRGRIGQWFLMAEVGRHVKVVIDGQGGDELLAGYSKFVFPYAVDRLLRRAPRGRGQQAIARELAGLARIEGRSRVAFLLQTPLRPAKSALGMPPFVLGRVQRRDFSRQFSSKADARERPYRSVLNNALWHELRSDGLPEVLHAEDALSMAFSVESRTPFLDHRLVELCFSLPFSDKISDGWTKSVLRRSLADVVPREILERRRKLGLSAPTARWLKLPENWRAVQELLLDCRCLDRGVFDARRLERALVTFTGRAALPNSVGRVWRWITLELWFRDFIDAQP